MMYVQWINSTSIGWDQVLIDGLYRSGTCIVQKKKKRALRAIWIRDIGCEGGWVEGKWRGWEYKDHKAGDLGP